ncbi:AAA family ATPase [Fontivita pretiosa]|uniref:AAA family ATPase n=1 Tax=Fontivita pretiosa TaxID=2989684 RepID=UPI003D17CE2A
MSGAATPEMSDEQRLDRLLVARHPCVTIFTYEENDALAVVRNVAMQRGLDLWLWTISAGLRDGLIASSASLADTEHPAAALYHLHTREPMLGIFVFLDLAVHLKDERTRRLARDLIDRAARSGSMLVLIDSTDELPASIAALATRMELSLPTEQELEQLVRATLRQINEQRPIQVDITRAELSVIVRNLRGLTRRQARQIIIQTVADDRRLDGDDVNHILAHKRRALSGGHSLLEYIETPTSLDDVGGLGRLKAWLAQRQGALTPDAESFGLSAPRGVLMLGVQGAGKSLAAKAIATAWSRPLLRMDVGALYDKYIGESERRLRDALRQAESMAPIILWIDEIEKAFASAAAQSSDGGLSKRMFGALLTWMQEHQAPVFLVATANDIEALPPELLRKGRFDEIFFVDLPTPQARRAIFAIHLRKRRRDPGLFDLESLSDASEGFSGAEIEQAIISALHEAFAAAEQLSTRHILAALNASPPLSVTMRERVQALRRWATGRCVPAD